MAHYEIMALLQGTWEISLIYISIKDNTLIKKGLFYIFFLVNENYDVSFKRF